MRVKLSDITNYSKGVQINGDDLIVNGEFAYLNGGINPSGRWNASNVNGNTVTISEGGNSSGYINYMTEPFWCGAHCYYLYDGPKNSKYLYYALKSQQERMFNIRSGACMPNIKKSDLGNFEFEFDYDEAVQNRVVSILSMVETIITQRKKELESFDELIKARFVELFGDPLINPKGFPVRTIDEVSVLNKGITYSPEDVADEGIIVLRSSNIQGNTFDLNDLVKITKKVSPDKYVQENDILMCNRNGSARLVGKVAKIPKLNEDMTFGTFMTIVRSDIHEYLFAFFQMDAFREQIKFQTAVAINQISLPLLASVKVPIPPIELIEEFTAFTEQVDKSKSVVQKSLDEVQLLFDSLMQDYFG